MTSRSRRGWQNDSCFLTLTWTRWRGWRGSTQIHVGLFRRNFSVIDGWIRWYSRMDVRRKTYFITFELDRLRGIFDGLPAPSPWRHISTSRRPRLRFILIKMWICREIPFDIKINFTVKPFENTPFTKFEFNKDDKSFHSKSVLFIVSNLVSWNEENTLLLSFVSVEWSTISFTRHFDEIPVLPSPSKQSFSRQIIIEMENIPILLNLVEKK